MIEGRYFTFKAAAKNVGPITVSDDKGNCFVLHRFGEPLKAGEIKAGQTIVYERDTGHVVNTIDE